jgi:hypothetical protein
VSRFVEIGDDPLRDEAVDAYAILASWIAGPGDDEDDDETPIGDPGDDEGYDDEDDDEDDEEPMQVKSLKTG